MHISIFLASKYKLTLFFTVTDLCNRNVYFKILPNVPVISGLGKVHYDVNCAGN